MYVGSLSTSLPLSLSVSKVYLQKGKIILTVVLCIYEPLHETNTPKEIKGSNEGWGACEEQLEQHSKHHTDTVWFQDRVKTLSKIIFEAGAERKFLAALQALPSHTGLDEVVQKLQVRWLKSLISTIGPLRIWSLWTIIISQPQKFSLQNNYEENIEH